MEYQNQAKQLFRRMNPNSPNKGSLESGGFLFQYVTHCYTFNPLSFLAVADPEGGVRGTPPFPKPSCL